ncbi:MULTISPECIES: type II secretion system protein [Thermodesulfovibrio]|jgi:type IV pilus assembly protein PilW|uniref:type II secretion system protein n=1 Tax=Thermodesulfovibrio TaxID=28261 RepID=UPI002635CB72|nr:type II secretion system protein [Thermodesulfovibrio sp.]
MNNRGFSIIEILVVIAILSILAGGIFSAFQFMARENAQRHFVAKQEQDAAVLTSQLTKDIETAGFGVDRDNLQNISVGNTLTFISLASREESRSGCWAMVRPDRTMDIRSTTYRGLNCDLNPKNFWYVILDPVSKRNRCPSSSDFLCQCGVDDTRCDEEYINTLAFFATERNNLVFPNDFRVTYFLNNANLPRECAPGTFNLMKSVGQDNAQPMISCVQSFLVRAYVGNENNPQLDNSIGDLSNFRNMIRLCMIIQVGGRQTSSTNLPQFSNECGGGPNIDNNWWNNTGRWYRWKVIEQDIVLRNYQAR